VFNDLDDNGLTKIIESEVCKFKDRLLGQGIQLKINKTLYKDLLEVLKSENIHAREIKDTLKQKLIIPTAKFVVSNPKKSSISIKMLDKTINIQ
jgi:ATP-dependent Clp protease ATP-binding subunit ClpA